MKLIVGGVGVTHSEIRELDVVVLVEQDVVWFDVAVNDVYDFMAVPNSVDQLPKPLLALLLGVGLFLVFYSGVQVAVLDELLNQVNLVVLGVVDDL